MLELLTKILNKGDSNATVSPPQDEWTPDDQKLFELLDTTPKTNLTRDLDDSPDSIIHLSAALNQLNVNSDKLIYIGHGSTAVAFALENEALVLKLSRPTKGDGFVGELQHSKDLLLTPIESNTFELPGAETNTAKAEVYLRVVEKSELIAMLKEKDPDFDEQEFETQFLSDKRIMDETFVKDGFLLGDMNNRNIGYLIDSSGAPVTFTDNEGNDRFVPNIIDYEKLSPILPEFLSRYDNIIQEPPHPIVAQWQQAKNATLAQHHKEAPHLGDLDGNSLDNSTLSSESSVWQSYVENRSNDGLSRGGTKTVPSQRAGNWTDSL